MTTIHFYRVNDPYGEFSNFSPHPISVLGRVWPTTEHYFQGQKFPGTDHEEAIRQTASPMIAARLGRTRQVPLRADWEQIKENVMRDALRAKFTQHPALRTLLLGTGDAELIEHTTNDSYWGDGGDGSGRNRLGALLMELRTELRGPIAEIPVASGGLNSAGEGTARLPFPRSYWAVPGRVLAGFYPGDRDATAADRKLRGLLDLGVTCVVNLMESDETDHSGVPFQAYEPRLRELARELGREVECLRFPIRDRTEPTVSFMRTILAEIDVRLARGAVLYVHCWGGRGRTGTVIGCHLARTRGVFGAAVLALLEDLTKHHPAAFWPAPEMPGQRTFVATWPEGA